MRITAIQTLGRLCNKLSFSDYASRIIHPLARILDSDDPELKNVAMETLCTLVYQLGSDYAIFIPMVNKVLVKHRIQHSTYETLVSRYASLLHFYDDALFNSTLQRLLKNQPLVLEGTEWNEPTRRQTESGASGDVLGMGTASKLKMNEPKLRKAWEGNCILAKLARFNSDSEHAM